MTLGQNIQNARRAQGLSQEALAEKIGVSRQALRTLPALADRTLRLDGMRRVAR